MTLKKLLAIFLICLSSLQAEDVVSPATPLVLDMVHHNPGEPLYESVYNDPAVIKEMGYNGKVYFLFDSPTLAVNWESVDPEILPKGSEERKWVDAKAKRIHQLHAECRAQGVKIFAQSDLVLFPKNLIKKYGIEKTYGDPRHPLTQKFLKAQLNEVFAQFPQLDGLVVRIGETYLHDAPYHEGRIDQKNSPEKTIIPLMQLLREEVCVKRGKSLVFRSWLAFDKKAADYQKVSDAIEPHPKFLISIKYCEGDFHRTNPFSKVIGQGRHRQLIEVQCAREYEGKGAYPNYIANGVIEGFEEYKAWPKERLKSLREFSVKKPQLFAGVWTWTRGGGWGGPYIKNEMWCDLNAWVMAQWANDMSQSEESLLKRYATERLKLSEADSVKFRRLCLLSASAVVRGRNSVEGDMNVWWTRDAGIGWPATPKEAKARKRNLEQKDQSVAMWKEVVQLAESIQWADDKTTRHAISSSYYGLRLYEIYRAVINLSAAESQRDSESVKKWLKTYDESWAAYDQLPKLYPELSSLYQQDYIRHIRKPVHQRVQKIRQSLK